MRLSFVTALCGAVLGAAAMPASAATLGLLPQVGLAGYGATVEWGFNKYLALSAGYTFMDQGARDVKTSDATYAGDVHLRNPQAFLRWAPFGGHFRISAGLVGQDTRFDLTATQFSGSAGALVDSARVTGRFTEDLAPALTIGWESPLDEPGLGYHVSAGAMYAGRPEVEVSRSCKAGVPQASCDAFTEDQAREVKDELDRYRVLPILQAGLIFRM